MIHLLLNGTISHQKSQPPDCYANNEVIQKQAQYKLYRSSNLGNLKLP